MSTFKNAEPASPSGHREEALLIEQARRRDRDALHRLIELHRERLFAFVWRMVRNHHDAEEICQDAFLKAIAALDSFDPQYRFSTWLFTIAYRLVLNNQRKKKAAVADIDFAALVVETETAESRAVESEEARRLKVAVWDAVDHLTTAQRAAVLLFYKHQQGCHEIAETLEIPVATVKSHLHRARARMKTLLESRFTEESDRDRILREFAG